MLIEARASVNMPSEVSVTSICTQLRDHSSISTTVVNTVSSCSGTCLYLSKVHVNRKGIVVACPDLIILTVYRMDSQHYMQPVRRAI